MVLDRSPELLRGPWAMCFFFGGFREFKRISLCLYSASNLHSPEPCLWMDQNFISSFWKWSPKEHSCEKYSKSDQRKRWLKNCLKKFHLVVMATRVLDGIKFCEHFSKKTSQGTFLPSSVQIGPEVWKRIFKEIVGSARWTTDTGPSYKLPLSMLCSGELKLCNSTSEICLWKVRKRWGKRRRCLLPAFSPFPRMYFSFFF